ncbi:antibiotic biosynthesis monooxygenase [Sinorhizobium fredii]|uniref:Antibiotic biosynthesis monooxygenase n=1 Tax=Rhizobium fredii TaxID=380 RepID=A0A2A6LWB6_RHIFR|nr:putative quinol monooxygenase [Sinorhizobium fredii]PDT46627.1 antibiotic biosynthesis monooxygenase [Sinorhizobium fredii]
MSIDGSSGHVVVVEFIVRAEFLDQFQNAILENAATSLKEEPGCVVFDVCRDPNRPRIWLYEVYRSEKDFEFHLKSAHFLDFSEVTQPWVHLKRVETFNRIAATPHGDS